MKYKVRGRRNQPYIKVRPKSHEPRHTVNRNRAVTGYYLSRKETEVRDPKVKRGIFTKSTKGPRPIRKQARKFRRV